MSSWPLSSSGLTRIAALRFGSVGVQTDGVYDEDTRGRLIGWEMDMAKTAGLPTVFSAYSRADGFIRSSQLT
jgi:hypothetical protein